MSCAEKMPCAKRITGLPGLVILRYCFHNASSGICLSQCNAIGKAIKKNKVKLKYGTFVYLVNGREKQ